METPKRVDASHRPAAIHPPKSAWAQVRRPHWEDFLDASIEAVFAGGGTIADLGGGLRLDGARGDKEDKALVAKFGHHLKDPKVRYLVTDYTDRYRPDRVEDIHALKFADGELDGLFCMAVLEHVYDPKRAAEEITRVLKPGGIGLVYIPFMYRYHAVQTGDYYDYFRASKDGIAFLFRGCREVTICPVRGLTETLLRFLPIHRLPLLGSLCRLIDWGSAGMRNVSQLQASGYFIRIVR
jgi:SAM-dependent methyltransferase